MKKILLSLILCISILCCACGTNNKNTNSSTVEQTTENKNVSKGMLNLSNQVIKIFEDYKNGNILKSDAIPKIKDIESQASDIHDWDFSSDYLLYSFIKELSDKIQNEYCDMNDYRVVLEDIRNLLNDTYESDEYSEEYSWGDKDFYLTKDWGKSSEKLYTHKNGFRLYVDTTYIDVAPFPENFVKIAQQFNDDDFTFSDDYDYYKTRKLNYFYVFNGKFEDDNAYLIMSGTATGNKLYAMIITYPENTFDENELHKLLDNVELIN